MNDEQEQFHHSSSAALLGAGRREFVFSVRQGTELILFSAAPPARPEF